MLWKDQVQQRNCIFIGPVRNLQLLLTNMIHTYFKLVNHPVHTRVIPLRMVGLDSDDVAPSHLFTRKKKQNAAESIIGHGL